MADTKLQEAPSTFEMSLSKALENNEVTIQELAELRELVSCTSDVEKNRLQGILDKKFDEKKEKISNETKQKLQELLDSCTPTIEVKESTKPAFNQVFEGTKSEMFSTEKIKGMSDMIDSRFPKEIYEKLTPAQRENIRLAMTDRLLKDPKIQGLFNLNIGVVDILGSFAKGSAPKTAEDAEKAKKSSSVTESISQAEMIVRVFMEQATLATQPLLKLLTEKNNILPVQLLSNPKAMAEYNGGDVPTSITEMNPVDLKAYIASLNGEVLKIDAKILGMEQIKEEGMNFLANAPSFLVDFFKWLLSFDFIAKLLGYTGNEEERNAQLDEELRQRQSLNILREFGQVSDTSENKPEGTKKMGKYSGKIELLKGKDLSKISRTKLAHFFAFTKEEGINIETPDFWMGIFNKGQIVAKDTEGKDIIHPVSEIKASDLEDNHKGLYEKLNKLKAQNDARKTQQAYEQASKAKQNIPDSEFQQLTPSQKKQAYKELVEWDLNTRNTAFSVYTLSQLKNPENLKAIEKTGNKKLITIYAIIQSLNQTQISGFEEYLRQNQSDKGYKFDSFAHVYEQREHLLSMIGYGQQQTSVSTSSEQENPVELPSVVTIGESLRKIQSNVAITEISLGGDVIYFDKNTQLITYKGTSYKIDIVGHPDIKIVKFSRTSDNQIQFEHDSLLGVKPAPVSMSDFSSGLLGMLQSGKYEKIENGKVIMRIEKV